MRNLRLQMIYFVGVLTAVVFTIEKRKIGERLVFKHLYSYKSCQI